MAFIEYPYPQIDNNNAAKRLLADPAVITENVVAALRVLNGGLGTENIKGTIAAAAFQQNRSLISLMFPLNTALVAWPANGVLFNFPPGGNNVRLDAVAVFGASASFSAQLKVGISTVATVTDPAQRTDYLMDNITTPNVDALGSTMLLNISAGSVRAITLWLTIAWSA